MTPHHAFPQVTLDAIAAELRREAEARKSVHQRRVEQGRMTEDEAKHQRSLIAAMLADVSRMGVLPWRSCAETHRCSWNERRAALQRELALRARHYPQWIAEGRLDQAEAERRCNALTALLWIYEDGFDWRAGNGEPTSFGDLHPTPQQLAAQDEWRSFAAAIDEARNPTAQQEMAL